MKSRWIGVLFTLLFLVFLITASLRIAAPLLDFHLFQLETKLIYIILTSIVLGGLLMFLLVAFLTPRTVEGLKMNLGSLRKHGSRIVPVQMAIELGDRERALQLLQDYPTEDPDFWLAKKLRADLYFEKGELAAAAKDYQEAIRNSDESVRAILFLALGSLYEHQDKIEEARDLYKQAWEASPNSPEPVQRLRYLAVKNQDWQDAIRWQELKEQQFGSDESAQESSWKFGIRYEVAREATKSRNFKTAQAMLKFIFRMTDYFTPAYLLQGELQEKQQNASAAIKSYELGFQRTRNPALLKHIGENFLMQNSPQTAIDFFRTMVRNHPGDHRVLFCLGDLYRKLEMSEEALKTFESIRERHPDWLLNHAVLADLYHRSGKREAALQLYKTIAEQNEIASTQPWQCYTCNTTYAFYSGFCVACAEWNSINMNQTKAGTLEFGYEKPTALPL